jgi:Zn-dependent protease
MAIAWALLLKSVIELPRGSASAFLAQMAIAGIVVNLVIMAINLLPILPLDGGRILAGVLPRPLAREYARTERWGGYVLLAFIAVSLVDAWFYDGRYVGGLFAPLGILIENVLRTIVGR